MDRILVYDGTDDKAMLIGELLGSHQIVKSISSSEKTMFVGFKKQYETAEFVASIKYNKINPDCQSWVDKNLLMSPNNPNSNCSWIFTGQYGSYISLDFSFVEVKQINI